jgi:hypothetical protein
MLVGGTLLLAGCAAAVIAPAYSADRQQRFVIEQVIDVAANKAWWSVTNDGGALPAAYSRVGHWKLGKLPYSDRQRWLTPTAPITGQPAPTADGSRQSRTVRLSLHANGADAISLIAPKEADIRAAGVTGFVRPIDPSAKKDRYSFSCSGRSCDGVALEIVTGSATPIPFTIVGSYRRLPAHAAPLLRARPVYARPQYAPDQTIVISRMKV